MEINAMTAATAWRTSVQHLWFVLISVSVTAGIFAYLFTTVSLSEVIGLLRGITPRWLVLFLLMSFSASLFRTWRYRLLLRVSGYRPNVVSLYLITLVRNFTSDLLPARMGTLVYIYLVQSRLNIPFGAAASSFAHDFIFDMVALAFLVTAAVLVQSSGLISPLAVIGGAIVLAAGSISVLLLLPAILRGLARISLALPLLSSRIRQILHTSLNDTVSQVLITKQEGIFWRIFFLSLGLRSSKYLGLYVLLLALVTPLGYDIQSFPLPKVFFGLCSAELAASLPVSGIAGFGAYEGAWVLVFQLLGYPERIAALTSISHHLFTQIYGYSLGGLALLVLLLPVFAWSSRLERGSRHTGVRFWLTYTATVAAIASLFLLFFPAGDETLTAREGGGGSGYTNAAAPKQSFSLAKVTGTLVYQRQDGIYTIDLQEKKPRRIVPFGTYPRWSPDGSQIAFVHRNTIMVVGRSGEGLREAAKAGKARAVCFMPDGRGLLFTDGRRLRQVDLESQAVSDLLQDEEFLEVDIDDLGRKIAFTVKTILGFRVKVVDLRSGRVRTVAVGCSASLAPDGSLITVNGAGHDELHIYDWDNLRPAAMIKAPPGMKFDNQYWTNHPQLVVATSEAAERDIYIQHRQSGEHYRVTADGDCDRADLHVMGVLP